MTSGNENPPFPWLKQYPKGVAYDAEIPVAPLYSLLDEAVVSYGGRPAFDFLGKRYTYGDLSKLVSSTAAGLQRLGVTRGTRVGLILPNCPYYPIFYFAALKAGATVVNFNPLYTEREIAAQVKDSSASIMVTLDLKMIADKLLPLLDAKAIAHLVVCPMVDILPGLKHYLYPLVKRKDIARPPADQRVIRCRDVTGDPSTLRIPEIDPHEDIALLQYTGGTTGVPKGAMLTHANVYANAVQSALWLEGAVPGQERMLAVIPFFHVFAMTAAMNYAIRIGAEIIALPRFEIGLLLKTIAEKKPTIFPAVPTIYSAINHHPARDRYDLSSIKYCFSGGAPLPAEVKETFERVTGCRLIEGYGLSETSPVTHGNPINGVNKAGSIGLPVPRTIVEIVSLEDGMTLLPPDEKGEICITGPQVMKGYWNHPEETETAMRGGRFHTGDIGYLDEDGYTFIVDRLKDIVIAGGFKIYPRIVEEAIYQHPDVEECIVAGIPDEYRGQTIKAWVKPREGASLTQGALKEFLTPLISAIEMPKLIEIRDTPLPKTLIGKLSRKAVLEEEGRK